MGSETKTIVCPNCGASTHNYHNCEYCGSLLVRFVSQNKTIDEQRYGREAKPLPGLEDELKKNLSLQKTCGSGFTIITTAFIRNNDYTLLYGQITPPRIQLKNGNILKLSDNEDEYGLIYSMPFQTKSLSLENADNEKRRLAVFKSRDCFFLFEPQHTVDGIRYTIDFGQDYEVAARIVSDVLRKEEENNSFTFETKILPCDKLKIDEKNGGYFFAPDISQEDKRKKNLIISYVCFFLMIIGMIINYILF